MKITVASNAGFCFGVSRAVDSVNALLDSIDSSTTVYILGRLIHNPIITADLERRGVVTVSADDIEPLCAKTDAGHKSIVCVRTHGVELEVSELLERCASGNPFFTVRDLTCPYVKKIHSIVASHAGEDIAVIGDASHPEVRGIVSRGGGNIRVYADEKELASRKDPQKTLILVAQTTLKLSTWKKSQKIIKKDCTNPIIFDTICSVTENRQSEAEKLASQVDLMLVVGSRDSSNTRRLYETAKAVRENTFFVEAPDEVPLGRLTPGITVGITAGASTPGGIIQEVINIMQENEIKAQENAGSEDFAQMLEDSLKTLNNGDTVHGVITSVSSGELHVDLGAKVTGIISADDVSDDAVKLEELFKPGDEVDAMVIMVSDRDGVATLSKKKIDGIVKWRNIIDAFKDGTILEGKVVEAVKGGVVISYDGTRLFVPASQTGVRKDGDLSTIVGQTKRFKVIDVNEGRHRAVASIRAVEREERKVKEEAIWASIEPGMEYDGVVKSLTSYGAFVDIGGVDGMVHSTELSWQHIKSPADVVSVGDAIHVYVRSVDKENKRISLGYKTEATNPWNIFTSTYSIGDTANVKIVSLIDFGAFAEIVPGVDGLIHISEISNTRVARPGDVLEVGQNVDVKIINIDYDKHKVSLSIKALLNDAPAEEAPAEEAPAETDGIFYSTDDPNPNVINEITDAE